MMICFQVAHIMFRMGYLKVHWTIYSHILRCLNSVLFQLINKAVLTSQKLMFMRIFMDIKFMPFQVVGEHWKKFACELLSAKVKK